MNYKLGSLFDGSGGFPFAGALCGVEPVWAAEVEPYPIAVTKSHFPKMKHLGDISKVKGGEIEPVDIITFGSPCQDLSVAGKRAGLKHEANGDEETTRSGLFMEAVRIIKEMRNATYGKYPSFALWENVPGAFSSNKGEDFRIVLEELIKIVEPSASMPQIPSRGWPYADSYVGDGWSIAYRVFDAQFWGVPQRRRRIHLVLDLRGQCAREVLFEREGVRGYFEKGGTPWQKIAENAERCLGADDSKGESIKAATLSSEQDQYLFQPFTDTHVIDNIGGQAEYGKASLVNGTLRAGCQGAVAYEWHNQDTRITGPIHTAYTLNTNAGGREGHLVIEPKSFEWHSQDVRVKPITDDVLPTISAGMGMGGANTTTPALIMEPFCKSSRSKSSDDATTWKEGKVANTLNTFDLGDVRANELVVEEQQATMVAKDPNAVAHCIGNGQVHDALRPDKELCKTLNCLIDPMKVLLDCPPNYIVRRLTPTECARLQGFPDRWGEINSFDHNEWKFWEEVRNTYADINGKAVKEYTEKQIKTWYNKLHTDSAEYKMWGNGIALPPALYVLQGIVEAMIKGGNDNVRKS